MCVYIYSCVAKTLCGTLSRDSGLGIIQFFFYLSVVPFTEMWSWRQLTRIIERRECYN